jgi:hypothetical protein
MTKMRLFAGLFENTSYSQKLHIPASPSDPESLKIRFLVIPAYSGITNIS